MLDGLREELLRDGDKLLGPMGFYVVDVEVEASRTAPLFRFFVDTLSGGITMRQVASCSRVFRDYLEAGPQGEDFSLEVSSPGIQRRIGRARDYRRFVGKEVRIRLRSPIDGKRKFTGTIVRADDAAVTLQVDAEEMVLPYPRLARANLTEDYPRSEEG
jgi:ribosome maturation factor RimP